MQINHNMENNMARKLISSGSRFEAEIGYSRAVVDGEWVFVSGTTGYNYATMTISDNIVEQTEQCLQNITAALKQANASMNDVVRVTYVLPNASEFELCFPVLKKYFGNVRPAVMMLAAGLADTKMKIEIQVTARKQARAASRKKPAAKKQAKVSALKKPGKAAVKKKVTRVPARKKTTRKKK